MMSALLEKVRQINQMVQKSTEVVEDFSPMAEMLGTAINANVYLVSPEGMVLGQAQIDDTDCQKVNFSEPTRLLNEFQQRLAFLPQPATNVNYDGCFFHAKGGCKCKERSVTIIPLQSGGERLGNLLLTRKEGSISDDDMILSEIGATVIGMSILRHRMERSESDARQKANVQVALDSLSFSEMEAISSVFQELGGLEGFLVASKIADRIGITRSVIVNAMRKLESAGVVESRSLGMKGTYIHVQNRFFLDELGKRARQK